jgi:hypothetical protein
MRLFPLLCLGLLLPTVSACAPARPTTPARTELVIDEATVVKGRRAAPPVEDQLLVPSLPQALETTSAAFQSGYALAFELLALPGPAPTPPNPDAVAYRAWLERAFDPWLRTREQEISKTLWVLQQVSVRAPSEAVPALALSGLVVQRFRQQMVSVPPPPEVSGDPKLGRIYQNGLNSLVAPFMKDAVGAYRRCTELVSAGSELTLGPWLARCQERIAVLEGQLRDIEALADAVAAEQEAERLAIEGPKPAGPELCWAPHVGRQGPLPVDGAPASSAASVSGAPAVTPAAGGTPRCARTANTLPPTAPTQAPTPRDLRYGLRDLESGVRVSANVTENPTMNAAPLAAPEAQAQLARCFAKYVPKDKAITVAVNAALTLDALGFVQEVELTPEPSDAATAPTKPLSRCLSQALKQIAFDCSPSAQPTQARASFCLRRDE